MVEEQSGAVEVVPAMQTSRPTSAASVAAASILSSRPLTSSSMVSGRRLREARPGTTLPVDLSHAAMDPVPLSRENLLSAHSAGSVKSCSSAFEVAMAERRAEEQRKLSHKQQAMQQEIEENAELLRVGKAGLQRVTGTVISEQNRVLKKQADVTKTEEELCKLVQETGIARRDHELASKVHAQHVNVTVVAQERTRRAVAGVEESECRLAVAKTRLEELEEACRRCHEAFIESDRVKDRETQRSRRAREVAEIDRVRYAELTRLVPPLLEPVMALKAEFGPINDAAMHAEDLASSTRTRLAACSESEFELVKTRDALLHALPKLRDARDAGYITRGEAEYSYSQASRFIVEHHYQKAFFQRTYTNTAPDPIAGEILEAVGNMKDRDYTDVWGKKGIGAHVIHLVMQNLILQLEQDAVVNCEQALANATREYDEQHEELMELRIKNERASNRAHELRAAAEEKLAKIHVAEANWQAARTRADDAEAQAKDSNHAMEAQVLATQDAIEAAKRASFEWEQARMKADLDILLVEELEQKLDRERERVVAAQAEQSDLEARATVLASRESLLQAKVTETRDAESAAHKTLVVKKAESDLQIAKQAKAIVKQEELAGEVKALSRRQAELSEELRGTARQFKYQEERNERLGSVALAKVLQSQASFITSALRKEVDAAQGKPHGTVSQQMLLGLEHHVAACGLQAIVGSADEAVRSAVGGMELVRSPAMRLSDPSITFKRWSKVMNALCDGATIVRESSCCRPVNVPGWVPQSMKSRTLNYTALGGRPIVTGKHGWKFVVEELGGKGFLLLGVLRDPSAADSAPIVEPRMLGKCDVTTVRRGTRFEAGTSDSFEINLNSFALGDCDRSWALSSDGVKVHDGKVTDFTGETIVPGAVVQVFVDLHAQTLMFSLNGKQLGLSMHNVQGPVVPAVSVTRAATCRVTLCDYWHA